MIYSHPMQVWSRLSAFLRSRFFPAARDGAATATMVALLALSPVLAGPPALAQEMGEATPVISVNINTADAEALAEGLSGVGLARAQEIVRHREAYGPFVSVDELEEVRGIGKATIDKNRPVITLE